MKKQFFTTAVFLLLLMLVFSPLGAQKAKRGRLMLSLNGGSLGGVEFLTGYYGGDAGKPLQLDWDVDTDKPRVEKVSAGSFGVSIGYILGTSARHANGSYRFSWYGEFTYCPTVKMNDGIETRRWTVWNQSQFRFVDMSETFPQTGRKAGMYGATLGVVYAPFNSFPWGSTLASACGNSPRNSRRVPGIFSKERSTLPTRPRSRPRSGSPIPARANWNATIRRS